MNFLVSVASKGILKDSLLNFQPGCVGEEKNLCSQDKEESVLKLKLLGKEKLEGDGYTDSRQWSIGPRYY